MGFCSKVALLGVRKVRGACAPASTHSLVFLSKLEIVVENVFMFVYVVMLSFVCVCVRACTHLYVYVLVYACMCVFMCLCMCLCVCDTSC